MSEAKKAGMSHSKSKVFSKKISVLTLLPVLLLAGCGKKVPECGDVQNILTQMNAKFIENDNSRYEAAGKVIATEFAKALVQHSMALVFAGITKPQPENLKFSAFSSTKKDKDAGVNYCAAMEFGEVVFEIKLSPMSIMNMEQIKAENEAFWGMDYKSKLASLAKDINAGVQKDKSIVSGLQLLSVRDDGTSLIVKVSEKLPEHLTYTANMTDKGDQALVTVTERN